MYVWRERSRILVYSDTKYGRNRTICDGEQNYVGFL